MRPILDISLNDNLLVARLAGPHRVLSWALRRGGLNLADTVVWMGVRNAELGPEVDPLALLDARLAQAGLREAVGMMTSTSLSRYERATASLDGVSAEALVTVGLRNALRAGDPTTPPETGTINLLVAVSAPLSDNALVEALALATEARTLAVREGQIPSAASGGWASGTGTDCVVVAAPVGPDPAIYAGKHTALGHVVGAAVLEATAVGVAAWRARWMT